jgi:hypothetical protein
VRGGRITETLAKAVERGLTASLRPKGRVILEHTSAEDAPSMSGLTLADTRVYGDTALSFYLR